MTSPPEEPSSFTIGNPNRIALDFDDTLIKMDQKEHDIKMGYAESMSLAEAGGRTRAVITLTEMMPYQTRIVEKLSRQQPPHHSLNLLLKSMTAPPSPTSISVVVMQVKDASLLRFLMRMLHLTYVTKQAKFMSISTKLRCQKSC